MRAIGRLHPSVRAAAWMSGTLASFTAMAIGGRELSTDLGTFEILFFRSLVGLLLVGTLVWKTGWRQLKTPLPGTHLVRNLAHFGGQFGWFYGLSTIPLAEVFAIEFTVPVWTAFLAVALLGERMTRGRLAAVGFGLAGMLMILRPGLAGFQPGALAVLGGAVGYALSHTLTKRLAHPDTPSCILFYMTAIQLPLGLAAALPGWRTPPPAAWPWILVVGVTALSAHYCMTRAFRLADATVVVPMDFLRLPLIAVVGFAVYGEPLQGWVLLGALVMVAGNLLSIRSEKRRLERVYGTRR